MAWNGADGATAVRERPDGAGRGRTAGPFDGRPSRHRLAGETVRGKTRRARRKRILLWGIILSAAVCAVWGIFRLLSGGQTAAMDELPSVGKASLLRAANPSARGTEPPSTEDKAPAHGAEAFVKRPGALQLPDGKVLTFPPPAEGEVRKVHAYGHTYECDHLGNFRDVTPRRLFHTAFEANFLALAQEDGPFIPAFLLGLDSAEVRRTLEKNYQPIGDETEDELRQLKAYDDLRCTVLAYMDGGGDFDDFVRDAAEFERDQRQARAAGLREVMGLVKEGRIEEAKVMSEAVDRVMESRGFRPVRLPEHVREAFDKLP